MTFKDARCPNCGGELQLPDNKQKVKCMYCGSDILVQEAVSAAAGPKVENLMGLARTAATASNHKEAYDYYTKVLELQPENCEAWFGKGESAGWLSDLNNFRFSEMSACFNKAIEFAPEDKQQETRARAATSVNDVAIACHTISRKHLIEIISFAANSWQEYLNRCGAVVSALEIAYTFAPDNKQIVENLIHIYKDNIEGVKFSDRSTYPPVSKAVFLSDASEAQFRAKMAEYSGIMRQMDSSYQPPAANRAKAGCFVATATMGSDDHETVILLREFRDVWLSKRRWGAWLVGVYYIVGPVLAGVLRRSAALRRLSAKLLVVPSAALAAKILVRAAQRRIRGIP